MRLMNKQTNNKPLLFMTSTQVFLAEGVFIHSWQVFCPLLLFFIVGVLFAVGIAHLLSALLFLLFFCMAFTSTVFHLSLSTGAVVGALGRAVSGEAELSREGLVSASVRVIMRGCRGYLIIRVSRVSWVVEVAYHECIKLYSSDAACGLLVASYQFVSIVGSAYWLLVHYFLLLGGL
jgi:hypothetical protein